MRAATILEAPWDYGRFASGVGAGPGRLIREGADQVLAWRGTPAAVTHIGVEKRQCTDLEAAVDLAARLRAAVREARDQGLLPVILAGNCTVCLGVLAGLEPARTAVVWMDAHPDFHTPDSSPSGSLDGMALALACGHAWPELLARINLTRPVAEEDVLLWGVRAPDPGERERLNASRVNVGAELPEHFENVEAVYLHIDIDVLSHAVSPGVRYRGAGGVSVEEAAGFIRSVAVRAPLAAVALVNYMPDLDPDGRTARSVLRLLEQLRP